MLHVGPVQAADFSGALDLETGLRNIKLSEYGPLVSRWQPRQWHAIANSGATVTRIFTPPHMHCADQGSFQSLMRHPCRLDRQCRIRCCQGS